MSNKNNSSVSNIYQLEGRVPVSRAIPFGLQHILAMFVANISPIIIVASASGVSGKQLAMLIQSAMLIAGIGTLIQLFPLWRIGSGLRSLWVSALRSYRSCVTSAQTTATARSWEPY